MILPPRQRQQAGTIQSESTGRFVQESGVGYRIGVRSEQSDRLRTRDPGTRGESRLRQMLTP